MGPMKQPTLDLRRIARVPSQDLPALVLAIAVDAKPADTVITTGSSLAHRDLHGSLSSKRAPLDAAGKPKPRPLRLPWRPSC